MEDNSLEQLSDGEMQRRIPLFVEKNIIDTLPDVVIIDHVSTDKLEFSFIPPLPKRLKDYNFIQ
ncbi:hypothetical protein [Candidatus Lokiarchaeum ossiferum]|uniref:hypothetical protein n=1 Tax=Candidatus Lokiarchaeum ossiferum TaxID=2951803 RepID=UPI00352D8208